MVTNFIAYWLVRLHQIEVEIMKYRIYSRLFRFCFTRLAIQTSLEESSVHEHYVTSFFIVKRTVKENPLLRDAPSHVQQTVPSFFLFSLPIWFPYEGDDRLEIDPRSQPSRPTYRFCRDHSTYEIQTM